MFVRFAVPAPVESLWDDASLNAFGMQPAVDVLEDENATVVIAELPGVRKEDVHISLEKDVLSITGERAPVDVPEAARVLMQEQTLRSFQRSFRIGHPVEREGMSATLENGILRIVLRKAEAARPRSIEIK